jgi:hypothetical protein
MDYAVAIRILLIAAAFASLIGGCVWLVRSAKRGGQGARAIGLGMILLGWGNMRDPRNDTVAEAQDGRIRKGTNSGDPPGDTPPPGGS